MKNSLRVRYKGADYLIDGLSKEDKELMRVEIGIAIKQDEERRKQREAKQPKKSKKGAE
jgi:hypothetical protein